MSDRFRVSVLIMPAKGKEYLGMKRTQEALKNVVNYDAVTGISPLEPPAVKKVDIPKFIVCPKFDRASQRIDRTMERYNNKVNDFQERLQQSNNEVDAMERELKGWEKKTSGYVDNTSANAVTRHNDAVDQSRRLRDRISDAIGRHNDFLERYKDAVRDAEEKLDELTQEALLVIDDDIVTVLDKCSQTAERLSDSENSYDALAALDSCFMALKVFRSFEEHMDGNVAREEARKKYSEISKLFAELCDKEDIRNSLADIFRRNIYLIEKNEEIYTQLLKVIEEVDQKTLDEMTQSYQRTFAEKFVTDFEYKGIIDPSELASIIAEIHKTIGAIKANFGKVQDIDEPTQSTAEAGVNAYRNAESLIETMKSNVEEMRDDLFFERHFACDMVEESVMEGFYEEDIRSSVTALRKQLSKLIGEEQIDTVVMEQEDRYSLEKAKKSIGQADLLRLQAKRDQVEGYTKKLSGMIADAEADIQEAELVPAKNANKFRSAASTFYILSCIPFIGFAFALNMLKKIEEFAPGFSSTNEIYRNLGTEIASKNKTIMAVNLFLGVVLGIVGIIVCLALKVGSGVGFRIVFPGAILVLYVITWMILANADKSLQSYMTSPRG